MSSGLKGERSSAREDCRTDDTAKEAWFMRREATARSGVPGRGRMGRGRIWEVGRVAG